MKVKLKNLQLRKALTGLCTVVIMFGLTTGSVLAEEVSDKDYKTLQAHKKKEAEKKLPPHQMPPPHDPTGGAKHGNLAEAATNPVANLIQFQVQNSYNWKNHNSDGYSNATLIQPVIPIALPWKAVPLLITRTTIPYVTTPDFDGPVDRQRGFGDTTILMLFTPKLKAKGMQLGIGPTVVIPTAGDNEFTGNGKWQAGPSILYINMQTPHLQWGALVYYLADFANSSANRSSDRPYVSKLSLQPFVIYHLSGGWFIGSPDTPQTYDYNSGEWTWALGPQAGRVTKIGKMPVKMFGEVLYNPEDNNGANAEWTGKVGLTFLFPE
jgi:hypothetical protein